MAQAYKPRKKPAKKTMPFEKKAALQGAASAILLAYCLIVSHTNSATVQKEFINKAVNITSTKNDMKNMLSRAKDLSGKTFSYAERALDSIIYFCNNGFGPTDTPAAETALASEISSPEPLEQETPVEQEPEIEKEEKHIFRMPAQGEITSAFGNRTHPISNTQNIHYGIDIAGNTGDCVISSLPGEVEDTGFDASLGNYVKIRHSPSLETVYGHLSEIMVRKGEIVDNNTRIGSIGDTGYATGPHLHLEVRVDGKSVDPNDYINKEI